MADDLARPEALTQQYPVYCGVWTNWDRGSIMGSTLTLPRRDADKLIALTAFFVALVSSRFWRLAAQIYHRCYSTQDPRDGLHHQRQAILRNSVSALADFLQLASLSWTWRGPVSHGIRRTLLLMISAAICAAGFATASVLSSWISTELNDEVLVSGEKCGMVVAKGEMISATGLMVPYWARLISNADNYAQQCYSSATTRMLDCTLFVKDHLRGSVNQKAQCPFKPEICRTQDSNLYLDTGLLDSGKDFGLNTAPGDRLLFRSVLHCAPLVTEGYTSARNTTYANYTTYHYGSTKIGASRLAPNDMTLEVLSRDSQYKMGEDPGLYDVQRGQGNSFILTAFQSLLKNRTTSVWNSGFVAIPELFRSDGDTQVIFLEGNGISFYEQTKDDWYRGTTPGYTVINTVTGGNHSLYWPEEAASPLGCVRQVQFCTTALAPDKRCGPLAAWNDALVESAPLFNLTGPQVSEGGYFPTDQTASRFDWVVAQLNNAATSPATLLRALGADSLTSKAYLAQGIMGRLPPNQWQLDVTHWWSTHLASIQAAFVETAIGPADPTGELEQYKQAPWNDHVQKLCNNQKIRSSSYTSFSMFGLCFTYATTGILIIVASYVTEPIYACLYGRYKYREYAHLEWTTNAILHFQRMAYQGINSGEWTGQMDDIPRTKPGEILAELPMRAPATIPGDGSEKDSTSDQADQDQEDLELDSLIGGDDAADVVSLTHDPARRSVREGFSEIHEA